MKYRTINAFRGDTVEVPLLVQIPVGTVVRVHLRKTPESDTFYNLDITNNKIIIPEDISSACDGTWYFDVEFTKDLVVETVQRVTVYFDDDISRVYGTEATAPTSDFERRKIYAESFYKRMPEGEAIEIPLEGLDQFVTDAQAAATEAQGYAESAANYANTAGTAAIAAFEAQELAETSATAANAAADAAVSSANSADQSAIAAEASASAAQVSAESASDYSDNASTFASNAYGAAQDAATAQQAAETAQAGAESAQSAAVSAKNAAQSAQSAAESAQSGAQLAKTAAETAQGLAEGARDAAVTAKNAAQTAQGLAETAKSGAETAQGAAETAAGTATTQAGLASGYKDTALQAKDDAVLAKNISITKASEADNSAYLAAQSAAAAALGFKSERAFATVNPAMVLQPSYNLYHLTLTQNSTITFDTSQLSSSGKDWHFLLKISMSALYTIAWPSNIYWYGGSDFSRIGDYYYNFISDNGGTNWIAYKVAEKTQYFNPLTNKVVYVDAAKADDTGNGLTWATAKKNVQAGIDLAIAGDLVFVKAGTYLPTTERTPGTSRSKSFIMKSGVHLYGGFQGTETSPGERVMTLTVNDVLPLPYQDYNLQINTPTYETILSGDLDSNSVDGGQAANYKGNRLTNITNNAYSVVYANLASVTIINGFKIQGGNANATNEIKGGGVRSTNSNLYVTNCIIQNNTGQDGCGIYSSTVNQCTINNNNSQDSQSAISNSIIAGCKVFYNTATNSHGGIYSTTATNCSIVYNSAQIYSGGGVIGGTINNCYVAYNECPRQGGGLSGTTATNCTIYKNSGGQQGGGGAINSTLINCRVNNNSAGYAGGLLSTTATNCEISNNYASNNCGAAASCTLINCTITKNLAGIADGGCGVNTVLKNCVVWGNRTVSTLHNVTLGTGSANYCAFENEVVAGTNNVNLNATNDAAGGPYFINPSLVAGNVEGATDYDISASSALINAGLDSYNTTGEGATYDLKHRTRKVGTIDIGAFEKQA